MICLGRDYLLGSYRFAFILLRMGNGSVGVR